MEYQPQSVWPLALGLPHSAAALPHRMDRQARRQHNRQMANNGLPWTRSLFLINAFKIQGNQEGIVSFHLICQLYRNPRLHLPEDNQENRTPSLDSYAVCGMPQVIFARSLEEVHFWPSRTWMGTLIFSSFTNCRWRYFQ